MKNKFYLPLIFICHVILIVAMCVAAVSGEMELLVQAGFLYVGSALHEVALAISEK